ncbi:MAG: hypothetical protein IJ272_02735, partial [Clostridia bacterium]|nr:hypothetical protein [Clostridia bacterium]
MNNIINQLPKMIMGEDINTELSVLPTYNDNIRKEDTTIRLMALSDLYNLYVPSTMSTEIYCKLYLALIHSLKKKSGITAIHQRNEN